MGGGTPIIHGRGETEETGTMGERFGPNKRFGIMIGGSYDWNGRGIDDIEPVPDVATLAGGQQVSWKDGMDIRQYQYFRSRWGLAGSTPTSTITATDFFTHSPTTHPGSPCSTRTTSAAPRIATAIRRRAGSRPRMTRS
jgi:hypothetical protein